MRKRRRSIGTAALVAGLSAAALLTAAGCDAISLKGTNPDVETRSADGWPFKPATMRIHPFTSIQRDPEEEALVLEARIELRDQLGHTTKGVGDFRFELYAREPQASQRGERRRVNVWRAPLRTLKENRRHYDPITSAYLFRLRLPSRPPQDDRLELLVQFNQRRGQRLRAESTVEFKPGEATEEDSSEQEGEPEAGPNDGEDADPNREATPSEGEGGKPE